MDKVLQVYYCSYLVAKECKGFTSEKNVDKNGLTAYFWKKKINCINLKKYSFYKLARVNFFFMVPGLWPVNYVYL